MSPRYYGNYGWPWPLDRGGINGPIVSLECATDAHYIAPTKACDLLRAKQWRFFCKYTGPDFPPFEKEMTTKAGTFKLDLVAGVTVHNEPGWETQQHVFEQRIHPETDVNPEPGVWTDGRLVRFAFYASVDEEAQASGGVTLLRPWRGWSDANLPVWDIPLVAEFGRDEESAVFCRIEGDGLVSDATGMTFLGEAVGEPNPDWEVTLDIDTTFEPES